MSEYSPFDRVVTSLRFRGGAVRVRSVDSVRASCPVHDDRKPSLVITRKADRVLIRCFAVCPTREVIAALGLRMADLFATPQVSGCRPTVAAIYAYCDLDGVVIGEKVRLEPKAFRWRRSADSVRGWRWGLDGASVGLYRWPELIDARQVLVVEGEKAVDHLRALGFDATCPPSGAAAWQPAWSADLWRAGCHEIIVLPDNDRAGQLHAERVAASSYGLAVVPSPDQWIIPCSPTDPEMVPLRVKVVPLPTSPGGDVCDWLVAGSDSAALRDAIRVAPYWTPGHVERERLERRRARTRERVRRHRARRKQGDVRVSAAWAA